MRSPSPDDIPTSAVGNIARLAYALALRKGVDVDRLLRKANLSRVILQNLRISLANRHLADKDLSISQIAWLLDYQDLSAFTSAYKHWTGHSPRAIRRRVR
jgi:AraC-like DNA-binding protein